MNDVFVWVFVGGRGEVSGVFSDLAKAEAWISTWALTGMLTRYPLDVGAYQWAVERGLFKPKKEEHRTAAFIGAFASAALEHHHYEDGVPRG